MPEGGCRWVSPPPLLPVCIEPGALGFGVRGSKYPCCHITALMQATRVSDFPVPAPPVMEETIAPSFQTLPDSQGLGGVQVMMLHKVTQDLLVLGREAGSQMWFLPGVH